MSLSLPIAALLHQHLPIRIRTTLGATAAAGSIAVALSLLVPAHAWSDQPRVAGEVPARSTTITTTVTDDDDTRGPLDISGVTHRITFTNPRGRVRLAYAVKTYLPFDAGSLDRRQRRFVVELDTDGRPGSERNVRISARNGVPTAEVISNATRKVIATVDLTRPDAQTLRIAGPRRLIGAHRYFWYSDFHAAQSKHCGWSDGYPVTCQDDVPENGWIGLDSPAWPRHAVA